MLPRVRAKASRNRASVWVEKAEPLPVAAMMASMSTQALIDRSLRSMITAMAGAMRLKMPMAPTAMSRLRPDQDPGPDPDRLCQSHLRALR